MFLDEPTAGFDPEARREFHTLVRRLADDYTTILLTTHDLDEAEKLADRILVLAGGPVIADGTAQELGQRFAGPDVVRWTHDGQHFVESTTGCTRFAFQLFRQYGESITNLDVRRTSLEETYLSLVHRAESDDKKSGTAAPRNGRIMNLTAVRAGWVGGLIELRQSISSSALIGQLLWPVATLLSIYLLRDRDLGAGGPRLGTLILPGVLGMFIALGMVLVIQYLAADREDGTLLRAKATPDGMAGYLFGKVVLASGSILAYLAIIVILGSFLVDGLQTDGINSWFTIGWVVMLGLVATQTFGAILGSLISSSRGVGYASLPVIGLIAISGVFYPIIALPEWIQKIAEVFPMYWLGLGMRCALLPDAAAAVEITGSWRQLETAVVLGLWAVVGLLIAPVVLGRMARRESGSRVADRRERALRRAV